MNALRSHRYKIVDVFAERAFEGNPLAVFPDATQIAACMMQKIARELNLSETVFVLPATRIDCAASIRIFTPQKEMAFAGHPTIGTSFVLLKEAIVPWSDNAFYLEEGVGPVRVTAVRGDPLLIWLTTPAIEYGRTFDRETCAIALGLGLSDLLDAEPQLLSAGNPTIFVALATKEAVDRAWLDLSGLHAIRGPGEPLCVFVFAPTKHGAYARMFAPEYGIPEDPATGSSVGPLAMYMARHGLVSSNPDKSLIIEQGTKLGRRSILHVRMTGAGESARIEVGGQVVQVGEGTLLV